MLTQRNLVSNSQASNAPIPDKPMVWTATNDYQDILPTFLPFFHIYGLMAVLVPSLAAGAKIVCIPKYDPNTFLSVTKGYRATFLFLVPPVVIQLNNFAGCTPSHFECVRGAISGASTLAESDGERFKEM